MNEVTIKTDKSDYTGGETVKGNLIVHLDDALPVRGVRLQCRGCERAHWMNGTGRDQSDTLETEVYFDSEQTVFGKPALAFGELVKDALSGIFSKKNYEILDQGTHEFAFRLELPPDLPGDYESPGRSFIRYELIATVDVPLRIDLTATKRLTIYEKAAAEPDQPVAKESSKSFLFDPDAPLELTVGLERSTFLPGDRTSCDITICNKSTKSIDAINVLVRQIEELAAGGEHKTNRYDLPIADFMEFERKRGEPVKLSFDITMPRNVYATITSSKLVQVRYELVVNLDIPWALDLEAAIPIVFREIAGKPSGVSDEG